ncbi:M28 family metallopeptidase [Clostridium sp. CF012]|uniref:M28 family metallopeptidase n=1 Tax=Clostridium sp. CF012 TaxID=2843319 RepID=UPI001C0CB07F|nr:M28 family metallopeptidase [Clostridium sp. CF012]MBU3146091.1 M28 family peptidase [Clostridium sp. CF012]
MLINRKIAGMFIMVISIINLLIGCTQSSPESVDVKNISYFKESDIQQENIMNQLKELISDNYKGRLAGSEGNALAAQYIADSYKKIGLENPTGLDNYMQNYKQPTILLKDKPVLQIIDNTNKTLVDFDYAENFVLRRMQSKTSEIELNAPLFLPDSTENLHGMSGKLEGKVLLIPSELSWMTGSPEGPVDLASIYGAKAVICEFDLSNNMSGIKYLKVTPFMAYNNSSNYRPFIFVDSDTFSKLVEAEKSNKHIYFSSSYKFDKDTKVANVIGLIPGSDAKLKDEYIIVGAHFDHVGDNMDGTYNVGALDNASGPSAMLEIARIIRESKVRPKKSILFIAFNGESSGQWGSKYYARNPIYPMDKAVMINLDMVGSARELPLLIASPENKSSTENNVLNNTLAEYAKELSINYTTGNASGSDHVSFAAKDVPSVLLTHPDFENGYHSLYDTIDKISGSRLSEVVKLVLYYIEKKAY